MWIPNNPHMAAASASDSAAQALTYIMSLSRGMIEQRLIEAYIAAGPEMVRFLDAKAGTEFYAVKDFPDYHPEHPGGCPTAAAPSNARSSHSTDWVHGRSKSRQARTSTTRTSP